MEQTLAQPSLYVSRLFVTPSIRFQHCENRKSISLAKKLYSILSENNQLFLCELLTRVQEKKISLKTIKAIDTNNEYITLECHLEKQLDERQLQLLVRTKTFDKILSSVQVTIDLDKQMQCGKDEELILQACIISDITDRPPTQLEHIKKPDTFRYECTMSEVGSSTTTEENKLDRDERNVKEVTTEERGRSECIPTGKWHPIKSGFVGTRSQNAPMFLKLFRVHFDIQHIKSCDLQILGNKFALQNIPGACLWEINVEIYDSNLLENLPFSILYEHIGYLKTSSEMIPNLVDVSKSQYIFIDINTSNKDAYKIHGMNDFVVDIITRVSSNDVTEGLHQLHALTNTPSFRNDHTGVIFSCQRLKWPNDDTKRSTVRQLYKELENTCKEQSAIVFCYLLSIINADILINAKQPLWTKDTASSLYRSSLLCAYKYIPPICIPGILKVLKELFKSISKGHANSLLFVYDTYNIFQTKDLSPIVKTWLKEEQKSHCPIPSHLNVVECLMNLFLKGCNENNMTLLNDIVSDLPCDLHLKFVDEAKRRKIEFGDCMETYVHELFVKNVQTIANLASRIDLKGILDTWQNITSIQFKYYDFVVPNTESAIVLCLKKINSFKSSDVLASIIKGKQLFYEPYKQIKLMEVISQSNNKDIREFMFELLDVDTFDALCHDEKVQSILQVWARHIFHSENDSSTKSNTKDQRKWIRTVYEKHNRITKTRCVSQCEAIQLKLQDLVFDIIQKCGFKVIAKVISEVENDDEIIETLSSHIRQLLTNGHFREKPNAMIQDICGQNTLHVKNKATAKLIIAIVETMDINLNECSTLNMFEKILGCSSFWIKIILATGKKNKDIQEHSVVRAVKKNITDTWQHILRKKISCKFTLYLQKEEKEVIEIFSTITNEQEVRETLAINMNRLNKFQIDLNIIGETFHCVKINHVAKLQPITTVVLDYTENQKKAILQGDTEAAELFMPNSKLVDDLSSFCLDIRDAASTVVFWNTMRRMIEETPDIIQDISDLPLGTHATESVIETIYKNLHSFRKAAKECLDTYKLVWFDYANDMKQRISDTAKVFSGVKDMNLEIEKAEKISNIKLSDPSRKNLFRFCNIKKYKQTVELIRVVAKAFKFSDNQNSVYNQTVVQFENMLHGNFSDRTLNEITPLLDQVNNIQDIMSESLKTILETIKESSALLDFLREVIDEDMRNLIDAVEEHSEQYVRESTVSDLIEIKRFFHPVLKANFTTDMGGLFVLLQKQIKETGILQIPEKMYSCRDNLHSLRALYQNVANRGEHTVELVCNIMHKGVFHFSLDKRSCEILVLYEQDKKHYRHTAADLDDLRSRVLLIMNAEKKGNDKGKDDRKENLESFVRVVDNAFEVYNISMKLRQSGHFDFSVYKKECLKDKMADLRNELHQIYNTWISEVESARKEHYYMNFLISDQLFELYAFLNNDIQNDEVIISILNYMNISSVNLKQISTIYRMFPPPRTYKDTLQSMGKTLDRLHSDTTPPPINSLGDKGPTTMLEKVQPGTPYIAWIDEGSPLVVRTLLALYFNTTNALPLAYQLVFCREDTTFDEIHLLLMRCLLLNRNSSKHQLFSIVNVENLRQDVQISLHDAICNLPSGEYLLCLICRCNESHPFLDQFTDLVRRLAPISESQMSACLKKHCSYVTVVTSDVPGAGKTEFIQNIAISENKRSICWHISGHLNRKLAIERLHQLKLKPYHVLHIEVGSVSDPFQLDLLLFELMILRHVSDGSTAYALGCEKVYIEIANTIKQTLCDSLPSISFFSREHIKWRNYEDLIVSLEINCPMQVVCTYLKSLDDGTLDSKDIYFTGPKAVKPLDKAECQLLLQKHFSTSGDLSYTVVNIFVRIMADQLKKLSSSSFFRTSSLQAMLGDVGLQSVKSNLVKALLQVSKDFSSRSVHTCRSTQAASILGTADEEEMNVAKILADRVSGMIRWEDSNHLVILFHHSNQSVSALYRHVEQVPIALNKLFESQVKLKLGDFQQKTTDELEKILVMLIRRSKTLESSGLLEELRRSYALTSDNLLKMVLISLRINANIPVLIMGETGCGKTSLIRYLAKVSGVILDVFSIHAGIKECQIQEKLATVNSMAIKDLKMQYWLFLDEINTCDHLGLISSALCHRCVLNIQLSPNVILLAACNPYRLRKEYAILSAGLQSKVKSDHLSKLVYRVHPLPENLIDFVWDFGSLSENDEDTYIKKMIDIFDLNGNFNKLLAALLTMSQRFVRRKEENDYCVSLRDVDRCRKTIQWLGTFLKTKSKEVSDHDRCVRSIILGVAVCYHSRFSDGRTRQQYREEMQKCFTAHEYNIKESDIQDIILNEQKDIIKRMEY